jgi:hypothetical protein
LVPETGDRTSLVAVAVAVAVNGKGSTPKQSVNDERQM